MIHISKYDCVAFDNLAFKGGISTRGTTFHCKACDKPAFKIKGVLDEATGTERATFLQGLKARHAVKRAAIQGDRRFGRYAAGGRIGNDGETGGREARRTT